ncbi:choline transport protein [Pseudohyphozyma bogoriensis]|nr:choline transport protein [Pseudohyphozyma bogoriensis]
MEDPKSKSGVYAARAVEVTPDAGGELERRDFVILASQMLGLAVLYDPSFEITAWKLWLIAEACILVATLFNIFCMAVMPILDKLALFFFLFSFLCYLIVPITCAHKFNGGLETPKFVFATFINLTGYDSITGGDFVAFMVGSAGLATAFGGTDAITHIAEECEHPERDVPKTMWMTVTIGVVSSFVLMISLLFAVVDVDSILASPTGVPYIQLVYNATQSLPGTVCMSLLVIIITFLALIGIVLACSRIAFTVARDGGFFTLNSFLNCVQLLNWFCYGICIVLVLWSGRRFAAPGPFRLGPAGWIINFLTVVYMFIQGLFFFFPYGLPAEVASMNYSSVVFTGLCLVPVLGWFISGHKFYLVVSEDQVEQVEGSVSTASGKKDGELGDVQVV